MNQDKTQRKEVANSGIDDQLRKAAARIDGGTRAQLSAAAIATVVSRMVQLDDQDQQDLFDCVKDLASIQSESDVQETFKTILEILEPPSTSDLVGETEAAGDRDRVDDDRWLGWISNRIRDARRERRMTQQALAAATGLPQSHISRLEGGKHSPSRKTLERIADALGVDVGVLTIDV